VYFVLKYHAIIALFSAKNILVNLYDLLPVLCLHLVPWPANLVYVLICPFLSSLKDGVYNSSDFLCL
jgi:hypothetical protein